MRAEEFREELERWLERVMELKERVESISIHEALTEEYYLKGDLDSILSEGLRRER
ncbi:MAG: hypothetical protein IIY21_15205 [Clostridiales bacterium]|nr:hypothetical protein [Clostridiales bacterium]